jgi:hypothetical protein
MKPTKTRTTKEERAGLKERCGKGLCSENLSNYCAPLMSVDILMRLIQDADRCAELEADNHNLRTKLKRVQEHYPRGECSGPHLGSVRSWIQTTFQNGNRVTWRSDDELTGSALSVWQMENLSHRIKDALISDVLELLGTKQLDSTPEQQDSLFGGNSADTNGE